MLDPKVVAEIKTLLLGGLSQRKAAAITGVSRGTIGKIASGERPNYEADPDDPDGGEPVGPPTRCPKCGGKVYGSCRLCRARAALGAPP